MSTATLENSFILIKPSEKLIDYINALPSVQGMPKGLIDVRSKPKLDTTQRKQQEHKFLIDKTDISYIQSLRTPAGFKPKHNFKETNDFTSKDKLINLEDLHWLHERINIENSQNENKVYLHELFEGSELVLPKNREIERNPELEKRCQKLKAQQDNDRYKRMTKNVDCVRRRHPDDTIAYQMKQINSQLIAVAQFIITVIAGFAFGFLGVELMIGKLDFGFRLLLGIICALVIALAELYFLAKKLNEDLEFVYNDKPKTKVD